MVCSVVGLILLLSSLFRRQSMNLGRTVFSQLVDFLPSYQFQLCVDRYQGDRYVKEFSCWDQFLCLAFAQLTYRESLRDIEACLRAQPPKLYHMGFARASSRNTLAHANEHRRLENLRRFRAVSDRHRPRALPQRTFRSGVDRKRSMPWTPPPSIYAWRFFRGENSAAAKAP